jgi:Na+-translocating ferredoxin:NAD+ oxidoreductase RnfC subunit
MVAVIEATSLDTSRTDSESCEKTCPAVIELVRLLDETLTEALPKQISAVGAKVKSESSETS